MKILVTGAAGLVGRSVVPELLEAGHEVRTFDRIPLPGDLRGKCESQLGEITDRYAVLKAVEGVDGVIHLAAIPDPGGGNALILFPPNVLGTQLVFAACEAFDVKRVSIASSVSIFGFVYQNAPHGEEKIGPHYLPMDEKHPIENCDVYGLSKKCNEETAAMYTRRTGMATTCLRLAWVNSTERIQGWALRGLENSDHKNRDVWAYVEKRDVARAFRLCIERVEEGNHVLNIVAQDYWSALPYRTLIERHYPHLMASLDEAVANGHNLAHGGWNTQRAQELLGWKSQHHWGDVEVLREVAEERNQANARAM